MLGEKENLAAEEIISGTRTCNLCGQIVGVTKRQGDGSFTYEQTEVGKKDCPSPKSIDRYHYSVA